jgi:hypothetical protein
VVASQADEVFKKFQLGKQKPTLIYELKDVSFVHLTPTQPGEKALKKCKKELDKIKKYLEEGFFYSFGLDLTRSLQQKHLHPANEESELRGIDTRYVWNYNLCKVFIAQGMAVDWCRPLIQGYVQVDEPLPNVSMALIARRRWRMGGTRYKARGVDEDGNVANHTEVEFAVMIEENNITDPELLEKQKVVQIRHVYSYVQVRGSMPFKWTQEGHLNVTLHGSVDSTMRAFKLHFENLKKDYINGPILCMNLVQPNKGFEGTLQQRFRECMEKA